MKINLLHFGFWLFRLLFAYPALSQEVAFNQVSPPEENPWSIVVSITQDPQGYMWFAGNGIHRYDGLKTISYRNDPLNPNSLVANNVECVFADDDGIIWIGTQGNGLDRFDPVNNSFTHYRHQPGNTASLGSDTVSSIAKDREGNIWIGTHGGLDRLNPKTDQFIHYSHNSNDPVSLSNNLVRIIYVDRQDAVWVGTGNPFFNDAGARREEGGLNRLNKKTGKFTRYMNDPTDTHSLIDNRVRAIYEDSRGTFWVGTAGDGLHTLDRVTGKFKRFEYDPAHPEKLSRPPLKNTLSFVDDHITFINEDATGAIWIGTMMGGINQYNPKTGKIISYGTGNDSTGGFRDVSGWAAYASRDGNIWISTWQANLFRLDPFRKNFPYYSIGEHVHGIYQETSGMKWILTHNGIIRMDAEGKIQKKYPFYLRQTNIETINFNFFMRDRAGKFWIGAERGLFCFDPLSETYRHYLPHSKNQVEQHSNEVMSLYEDRQLNLWVGTYGGLVKMDRKTGEFFLYRNDVKNTSTFVTNFITKLLQDKKNQLWVGTLAGINKLDTQTGKFKGYLKGLHIMSIYEDAESILWIGGPDGLFRYNATIDSFFNFVNPGSGLRFKNVYSIIEDEQNKLWINTTSGIFRFNPQRDSSNAFGKDLDLKNIISRERILNGQKGEFFLGDQVGYYDILPLQVSGNFIPPQVVVSNFWLGEQSVLPGPNSPLQEPLARAKEIRLNYQQNVFSFDIDVMHFSNYENNQLLFKLENYDNAWRQPGTERRAIYFNVPPGHYMFRVKASNSNGVWTERNIEVIINPPWWQTWWAYTIFGLILLGLIWGFIYYRSLALRRENRLLEEKVTHRTAQLQQSLEDLKSTQTQLVQREKMASLGELTAGIAHEIQNPLNFVNNFSEVNIELLVEMKDDLCKGNLEDATAIANDVIDNEEKINHHGKRADAIVKGMLQHSRSSSGVKEPTNINALADEYLRLAYHGLRAKDKSFNATMKTDFDDSIGSINIIPQDIGRVLLNLINNAFYAVNEKK
ncbi:MAG: ligand-binding sensor domain-containing protein, partial [Chitinophagaceae bacterium]